MFLIRCTFWLAVVYASMFFGGGMLHHRNSFEAEVSGSAAQAATLAHAVATCGMAGARCLDAVKVAGAAGEAAATLADAAAMTALVHTVLRTEDDEIVGGGDASSARDAHRRSAPRAR